MGHSEAHQNEMTPIAQARLKLNLEFHQTFHPSSAGCLSFANPQSARGRIHFATVKVQELVLACLREKKLMS